MITRPGVAEVIHVLHSTCCKTELQVAIYVGKRVTLLMHGAIVTEEGWDPVSESFPFTEYNNVAMKVFVSASHVSDSESLSESSLAAPKGEVRRSPTINLG